MHELHKIVGADLKLNEKRNLEDVSRSLLQKVVGINCNMDETHIFIRYEVRSLYRLLK